MAYNLVFSSTSIHGLQQIGKNEYISKAFWWCCIFAASMSLMCLQISLLTNHLSSHPKVVVQEVTGGTVTFPAVTVCSLGLVRKSMVSQHPTFIAMESALKATGTASIDKTVAGTVANGISKLTTKLYTNPATPSTSNVLQCQQNCSYWEPFCFIDTGVNSPLTNSAQLCQSLGGSLPTFPSTNYTTFARFNDYFASKYSSGDYFWMDYRNAYNHDSNHPGNWTDSFGRLLHLEFLNYNWYAGQPSGQSGHSGMIFGLMSSATTFFDYDPTSTFSGFDAVCMCHCPDIQPPVNGYIIGDKFTDLTMSIRFGCNPGCLMIGSPITKCNYAGAGVYWSDNPPQCKILMNCSEIVSQMFLTTYNPYPVISGTIATFTCPNGFNLYGKRNATCYDGTWDIGTSEYPICSDIVFPMLNKSQFLDIARNNYVSNTLSVATTFYGLLPYILSSLTDAQMAAIGFKEANLIAKCIFDRKDCEQLSIVSKRDSQYGMCYTFNHMNMSQYYTVSRAGETAGLKLLLFSLQGEYLSIVTSGGLKMFVHDQNDPIFYGHNGFMLSPGLTYSIPLQKAMEIRLNTPNDLCVEDASQVRYYNFYNSSYFQEACISSYIQTQIVLNCSCSSPTLPSNDSKIPVCGVVQQSCVQKVYNNSDTLVSSAKLFCPPRCSYTYYKRTSTSWLTRATQAATRKLNISQDEYLRNTVDVSMYFQTLDVMSLREVASYTVINLLSDLGATMGVLVGMSVVSWVEFLYAIGQCIKVCLCRRS